MTGQEVPAPVPRAPRKDAARNHDALLVAAGEVYSERGVDASLEEIARRANVGIGTLYRHFPTRAVLDEAVYRREVALLCDRVPGLLADLAPVDALSAWMTGFAEYVARKRGMAEALKSALGADSTLFADSRRRLIEALGSLVTASITDGSIRADVEADDLLRAMHGVCLAAPPSDRDASTTRLVGLLVDGLRYGAPAAAR